jgi:hypothetical protein
MAIHKSPRRRILAIGATAALAVGLVGTATVALAHDPAQEGAVHGHSGQDHGSQGGHFRAGLHQIFEASGLDRAAFVQGLRDGKSINQILQENGLDPATIQSQALALLQQHLDSAVADGKLTQEQADNIAARSAQGLADMMDRAPVAAGGHAVKGFGGGGISTAAATIGIEVQELVDAVRAGQTIADVATANGVAPQSVIDALLAEINTRIDQAAADGKIPAERAQQMKERALERTTRFVNEGRPRGHHFRR